VTRFPNNDVGDLISTEHDWVVVPDVLSGLGHSSIAITGDVYGHTSDDTARAAVDALAGRLGLVNVGGQSRTPRGWGRSWGTNQQRHFRKLAESAVNMRRADRI
jgi:hypothetical protein